jgi:osmotically-inducible protein OsmY
MKMKSIIALSASLLLGLANIAIADDVDDALQKNLRLAVNQRHVDIHVDKGVVTIEGEVRSEQDRQAIDPTVRNTAGVAAVKNNLRVKLATPGTGTTLSPSLRPVPVYMTAPPEITTPVPVIKGPAPVVVPDYPKVKIQAWAESDMKTAHIIARQLKVDSLPGAGFDNVVITLRSGIASLKGTVSREAHDMLIVAIQKTGESGNLTAIYDQLEVR